MEKLLKKALSLAAESGADLLEMLERIVENAEYSEDYVTLDPEIMDEARNFLYDFKYGPLAPDESNTLH